MPSPDALPMLPARPDHPDDESGAGRETTSLWSLVNDRLWGRWRMAVAAGLLLGALLGTAAFFKTVPQYQSSGLIRVVPKIDPILRETFETSTVPLYLGFIQTRLSS